MSDADRYQHIADRYNAAFDAHEKMYRATNPPPRRNDLFIYLAMLLIMTGASFLSAAHTIPSFLRLLPPEVHEDTRPWVALGGLLAVEGASFVFALIGTLKSNDMFTRNKALRYVKSGGVLILIVMCVVSVYDVLNQQAASGDTAWLWVTVGVSIAIGMTGPIQAFLVGHALAIMIVTGGEDDAKWREGMLAVWDARKGKMGAMVKVETMEITTPAIRVERERALSEQVVQTVNEHSQSVHERSQGGRNVNARSIVEQYLRDNPTHIGRSLDWLTNAVEQATGERVGRGTVNNVRVQMGYKKPGGEADNAV